MSTWTAVYRKSIYSPAFVPTDLHGTWTEVQDYAKALPAGLAEVYTVKSDDTEVVTESGRRVRILPTVAQKNAAMDRANRIANLRHHAERDQMTDRLFHRAASRLVDGDPRLYTNAELAAICVDAGWDWATILTINS